MAEDKVKISSKILSSVAKTIIFVIVFVIIEAIVNNFLPSLLSQISLNFPPLVQGSVNIQPYLPYINILLSLLFGYLIITEISNVIYWNLRIKYDHPVAHSVRNVIRILGVGVLGATIAGAVAGGVAGVALGGFIGVVIGFATQQVLGQAVAGLFVLIARPFKIGDQVNVGGDIGVVEDITTLFTIINKGDQLVLIPNNTLIGSKIYVIKNNTQKK
ncbi:mechanosensitive ion channel domain-containing protein [Sulfolobus acidocaldarius]|uniref:Conserved membrane protein n=4 Tax=Sulfolobus acidocaldarius TaxID=2285 RepID=Q4JAZ6_SULAC|nr:mechanosensitive ion channel domain-containing protein [Sulfolobus acidocaldarius]AAY80033.1 conserved membrane protein [Sulfolobus acidocaldarius DSM 639]AGE70604.1 hypothetical protein SacN8_03130 [Sulfolobus acidocaldarius N8]AGE72877.1 hypothetical protein SacRon12I_03120 [Sulfolobus acidocaldarius Ron12/I]ALU29043.1 small-conductance mechanosensitive channel [Sulfolobus acidocaldarius]ALU31769.1 small-conductance mechanosensitive channel [Sulfolobus acidocaldarius]